MKQIILTAILISAFCLTIFSQTNENANSVSRSTPKLLAEFNDKDSEWYKLTAELIGQELVNNSSVIGLIKVKNDSPKKLALRLHRLNVGFAFRKVDSSRITFLLVDKQEHDIDVLIASDCSEILKCEDCIVIRAIDVDKIEKLFRPKTIKKIRKKK